MPNSRDVEILELVPSMVKNALGVHVELGDISELSGGTFNQVYLVEPPNQKKLVVRIAPAEDENTHLDDTKLMRCEYAIQPYFTPVAALMPTILAVDFTHQLVSRDYMIQSYVEGERWEDIADELDEDASLMLWAQFGELTRRIHDTVGNSFGGPYPRKSSSSWHEVVVERFEQIIAGMAQHNLDTFSMSNVLALVHGDTDLLSTVTQPRLLHGDLWLFNLLVDRNVPEIVGLLDADRSWWGDPLADMTIFLVGIRDGEESWIERRAAFEAGYGPIADKSDGALRLEIYKIMHLGTIAEWAARNGYDDVIDQACKKQAELAELLLK